MEPSRAGTRNEEQGGGFNSISPDRDSLTRGTINISQFTLHISSRFLGRCLSPLSLLSTPIWTTAAHTTLSRDPPSDRYQEEGHTADELRDWSIPDVQDTTAIMSAGNQDAKLFARVSLSNLCPTRRHVCTHLPTRSILTGASHSTGQSRRTTTRTTSHRRKEGQGSPRQEDCSQEDRCQHDHEQQRYDRPVPRCHPSHGPRQSGNQEDVLPIPCALCEDKTRDCSQGSAASCSSSSYPPSPLTAWLTKYRTWKTQTL